MAHRRSSVLFCVVLIVGCAWAVESSETACTNCYDEVSSGRYHTCAIGADSSLTCWGDDAEGQSAFQPTVGWEYWQVAAGGYHTCGLFTCTATMCPLGNVECWGLNTDDQTSHPENISYTQVSTGRYHSCGLTADGLVDCWGNDVDGQSTVPAIGDSTYTQVSAGAFHTCALFECTIGICPLGNVECWGMGTEGQTLHPVNIPYSQVSTGRYHSCGLRTDGSIDCWGSNEDEQSTPPLGTFTEIASGDYHNCALTADGTVSCWGGDNYGQSAPPLGPFESISAGGYHTCGLKTDGTITCWGSDSSGQSWPPAGMCGLFQADFEVAGDCRWTNGSTPAYVADCDDDGYASRDSQVYCVSFPVGLPPECPTGEWIDQPPVCGAFDCLDSSADVHTGQTSFFDTGFDRTGGFGFHFDYNCDGAEENRYTNISSGGLCCSWNGTFCQQDLDVGCAVGGWDSATVSEVPECGGTANYWTCAGSILDCGEASLPRTQECR